MNKGLLALAVALATAAFTAAPALAEGPNAVVGDPGCRANQLDRNDDGSTNAVPIGFNTNFFGTTYTHLFVNNNGNVTFNQRLGTYTPFQLTSSTPPIIAPFFADVDTRGSGSDLVRYSFGPITFNGRPSFCVNWVNVGYYAGHFDKLNSFQLLLVDRSDVGVGDFDIVFNYDKVHWETGDASGGSGGLGGTSAGAGFSAGNGNPNAFFQVAGSLVNGALLDSNPLTGLIHGSRGTLQLGRYIFPVRNGAAPAGGAIHGIVSDSGGNPQAGAPVQVCRISDSACVFVTVTNSAGGYNANGLPADDYSVRAFPPMGSSLLPKLEGPIALPAAGNVTQDIVLTGPMPLPAGTSISPSSGSVIPVVYWGNALLLETNGCPGGAASYEVRQGVAVIASGPMAEGPAGHYSATIPPFHPTSGLAIVSISIACPGGGTSLDEFSIYIDPSGLVRTPGGNPIEGATVTLYRADSPAGPFVQVPNGSAIMSPVNRDNPDLTDATGHFGWDVIAGFYKVRAQKADCHAPGNPAQLIVESPVLTIPPPVTDLDLRLAGPGCPDDLLAPITSAVLNPLANAAGWNAADLVVELEAVDNPGGSGVASITFSAVGADAIAETTVDGDSASIPIDEEGITTITYYARDAAGNVEAARTQVVKLDKTAPELTVPDDSVLEAAGPDGARYEFEAQASDALDAEPELECDHELDAMYALGSHTVECSAADDAGNSASESFVVRVVDTTKPAASCEQGTNPSGDNKPNANAGFRKLSASDAVGIASIVIADSASSFVSSPLASGDTVKLTQSKGSAGEEPGEGAVAVHVKTKGDPILRVTDTSGNVYEASCGNLPPA